MFGKWLLMVLSMVVSVMLCALLGFMCFGCLWWWRELKRQDRWETLADAAEVAAGGGAPASKSAAPAPGGGGPGAGPAPAGGGGPPGVPGGAPAAGRAISRRGDGGMTR
ncbi:hypothetical protein T484DRAFT_1935965 [Baffinella frigidus]|nr:hypothetical protein T484DRAFT_1935965 [Cryptophyta sp. CCMP2293]